MSSWLDPNKILSGAASALDGDSTLGSATSDITDTLGPQYVGDFMSDPAAKSLGGGVVPSSKASDSLFSPGFFGSLITAGSGLAGAYYTSSNNKDIADQNIAAQVAQNDEAKREFDAKFGLEEKTLAAQEGDAAAKIAAEKEIAGIDAGAKIKAAKIAAAAQIKSQRMSSLSSLYNTWGTLTERGGEALGNDALQTGKMGQDPIIARATVLR